MVQVNYKVTTRTSDIRYAGTDSMIYIVLHGDLLESAPARPLLDGNSDQPFRRGQVRHQPRPRSKQLNTLPATWTWMWTL